MTKLFDIYSAEIFTAIMPTVPQYLARADVAYDSPKGMELTDKYKHVAFGYQLLYASLFGWNSMTTYVHIIAAHSALQIMKWGSIGLWSQSAFEAKHKILRSVVDHTTHDGGMNGRSKVTRELSQQVQEVLVAGIDNCALKQGLIRVWREYMFDIRYELSSYEPTSHMMRSAQSVLQRRYEELDAKLPDDDKTALHTVKRFAGKIEAGKKLKARRRLDL